MDNAVISSNSQSYDKLYSILLASVSHSVMSGTIFFNSCDSASVKSLSCNRKMFSLFRS